MKAILTPLTSRAFAVAVCPLLLCSCATDWRVTDAVRADLPRETSFNKGAGRGDYLFLPLCSEDGEKMLFLVDTGAWLTILDQSLEARLGKSIGTQRLRYEWFNDGRGRKFKAPPLFLGDTRLLTGEAVVTDDLTRIAPGRPVMGILGMDCLRHYCVQLDFVAGKIRFLDPDKEANELGVAIPLGASAGGVMFRRSAFGEKNVRFILDTGDYADGALSPKLFQHVLQRQHAIWTNEGVTPRGVLRRRAYFAESEWGGETYTNLWLEEFSGKMWRSENLLGLRLLARHVVTLNFPKRVMYLDRQSTTPLPSQGDSTNAPTLGWFDDLPAAIDKNVLAERFLGAPNLRPANALYRTYWWAHFLPEFLPLRISVGPPRARLSTSHLPPGNYPFKFVSKVERGTNGEAEITFNYLPETNRSVISLEQRGTIILLPGYNAQKESMTWWAYRLAEAGYRAVLVDLRGRGESTGQMVSYGKYETEDLRQLLDKLREQHLCDERIGVLGVGYGAHVALQWAARDSRVRTAVVISPYDRQEQVFERMAQTAKTSISTAVLRDAVATVTAKLEIDWTEWSGQTALHRLTRPVLLIGGGRDTTSSTNELSMLQQTAPQGSQCIIVREGTRSNVAHWFHEIEQPIKAWFETSFSTASGRTTGAAQLSPR